MNTPLPTVFIVDDEPAIRDSLTLMIEQTTMDVLAPGGVAVG